MKDFDDSVRDALRAEEGAQGRGELSLVEQVQASFRGRNRWLVITNIVLMFIFVDLALYCFYQHFFGTHLPGASRMMWGMGGGFFVMAIALMEIWYWMELNKNAVLREVKRLELQIARLAEAKEAAS